MNIFFVVILAALIAEFVIELVADFLNLRALSHEPPAELKGVYDPEKYRKSQEYTRVTTGFGIITAGFRLAVVLTFWLAGGFNALDQAVRDLDLPVIVNGILFVGVLALASGLLMLPFEVFHAFVIEERFGFNKTTLKTFILDQVKGVALMIVVGLPVLAAVLAFFEYGGDLAWLYCWVAVTALILALQYVAPTWIMPLFNKLTPLPEGELRTSILDYAKSFNFTLNNILVMDGSKRSTKSNAFFTGFGRNKRIALFDTLVKNHTVPELTAVLAHEIGHYKKRHIVQGTVIGILHLGALLFLFSLFLSSQGLHDAFFMDEKSVYAGIVFFGLLFTPIEMVLSPIMHWLSRRNEYEADRWSVDTYGKPQEMAEALKKLSSDNLSNLSPHPMYVFLHYTHPPLLQRVRAIERAGSQQSAVGSRPNEDGGTRRQG
ncbi:MAG: M48 family metallopeptidase [SAR202 cluster bacterium]|nr:M48 family metallopeptidase [SAR202 cluster bacterium]